MAEVEVYGCGISSGATQANQLREANQPLAGQDEPEFLWQISPNPFEESFILEVFSELEEGAFVELYNALGQRMAQVRIPKSKEDNFGEWLACWGIFYTSYKP